MKLALGLFHFNVQYAGGEPACCHRYCTEAVIPFLDALAGNPRYRVSFEMAGNGLEFLAQHYPSAIDLLRDLVERDQVELISATYAPTVWVAFPKKDLVRSIELNWECLERLKLKAARIFFAQEAFFGPGLKEIAPLFPIAICKDDYLNYFAAPETPDPIYHLGGLRVVVGAGHIINELAAELLGAGAGAEGALAPFYRERLKRASRSLPGSRADFTAGSVGDFSWRWYHMGSGHHLATPSSPEDWEGFFHDPAWSRLTIRHWDRLLAQGYRLGTIAEFVQTLGQRSAAPLPDVVEGSWNAARSSGVYAWMGRHEHPWENDAGLLGLAWRSRGELRRLEVFAAKALDGRHDPKLAGELGGAWRCQILAESSDPLGWKPSQAEIRFGRENTDRAFRKIRAVRLGHPLPGEGGDDEGSFAGLASPFSKGPTGARPAARVELVGSEGSCDWMGVGDDIQACEAQFRAVDDECGVRFLRVADHLAYCPSGMESEPVILDAERLRPAVLHLPLANGLISLGPELHLIRVNCFGQVAVRISKGDRWLVFAVQGASKNKPYRWRFLTVRGSIQKAAGIANAANLI